MSPSEVSPDATMVSLSLLLALLGGIVLLLSLPLIALLRMRRRSKNESPRGLPPRSPLDPWHESGRRQAARTSPDESGEEFLKNEDEDA
ncbi:MAG: hypothetical protein QMB94_10245 [Phycisphaerales bacterium]